MWSLHSKQVMQQNMKWSLRFCYFISYIFFRASFYEFLYLNWPFLTPLVWLCNLWKLSPEWPVLCLVGCETLLTYLQHFWRLSSFVVLAVHWAFSSKIAIFVASCFRECYTEAGCLSAGKLDQSRSVWSTWQRLHDCRSRLAEWSRWRAGE